MANKVVHIIGGGTISHIRNHLALSAPAYGSTARRLAELSEKYLPLLDTKVHLTKMADNTSSLETPEDVKKLALEIVSDPATKIVFFNPAIVDFNGQIGAVKSGKYAKRLDSRSSKTEHISLSPNEKILKLFRQENGIGSTRKDIFLVGFKTTCGASEEEQFNIGLNSLKSSSCNLVLANDTKTRVNMIITPEEACYHVSTDRDYALIQLVKIANLRSHLTFTRSTVVSGDPIPWSSPMIPESLRAVVDHCISAGAYKKFRGVTAGHFAVKIDDQTFLTSRRKTDFNDMAKTGLVKVRTDGPDNVIAYGSKPSVGGQSQRKVFAANPNDDCIVHFHCPKKPGSKVPTVSQREYECGSHECGENTTKGLRKFGEIKAVYLDNHGPNLVFSHKLDPQKVIEFIEHNFDLRAKTSGYKIAKRFEPKPQAVSV